ncbi:hypothetical protein SS50377_20119 [Spironucleus salmonicida]|uniref:Uncharacterized protein n=1 Tax=Spironucleus salmonicida TaxID=348837 RepID=V6LKM8_9EUKA|nr:hypothetical protein SS50377_20119 [Spironucleus salmonicida]|eukprot:EST45175.1 Hypothetical protein SS50377_14748 [Spironucleus salmonicida]
MDQHDLLTSRHLNTHLTQQTKLLNARILDLHTQNSSLKQQLARNQLEQLGQEKRSTTTQNHLLQAQKSININIQNIQASLIHQVQDNTFLINENSQLKQRVSTLESQLSLFTSNSPEFLISENHNLTRKNAENSVLIDRQKEEIEKLNQGFLGHSKLYSQIKTLKQALLEANAEIKVLKSRQKEE